MTLPIGTEFTEQHRHRITEGLKKYYRTHDTVNKGVPHTDETRKKISESCRKAGVGTWNKSKPKPPRKEGHTEKVAAGHRGKKYKPRGKKDKKY